MARLLRIQKLKNLTLKENKLLNSFNLIYPTATSLIWAGLITTIVIVSIIIDQINDAVQSKKQKQTDLHFTEISESPKKELTLNRF